MDLLQREGLPLARDIIYLAVSDEEMDSSAGSHCAVHAEYVWDEGGFGLKDVLGPGTLFPAQ
jgi:hypothetical protein